MKWPAAVLACALCVAGCGKQEPATPPRDESPAPVLSAPTQKSDSLPFPSWSQFKAQENFDTTGPLERLMIWQTYRDRVVPAVAAHQGIDPAELQRYFESRVPRPIAHNPTAPLYPRQFSGYPCTQDCSGHEAGYDWAEENEIADPDDCSGKSQSFIEGCQAYAEERQAAGEE